MDREAADRISAAARREPGSPTATSRFAERARRAADRNRWLDPDDRDRYVYDD
jgi:hypothetical protein